MTNWIKVHNSMPQHPKLLSAGDRAAWLQVCGLCYANEHLTDGFIPRYALPVVAPGVKGAERLAQRLVDVGVWRAEEGGWRIHDYTEHQRSAGQVRERRAKDAARKSGTRSERSPHGQIAESGADSARIEKKREEKRTTSSGADRAERERGKASEDDQENLRLFVRLGRERNPKMKVPSAGTSALAEWYAEMRRLRERDDSPAAEIGAVIRWIFTDASRDAAFWGTTVASPSGLREHYPQIWGKMIAAAAPRNGQGASPESSDAFLARRGAK